MTIEFGLPKQQHDLITKQAMKRAGVTTVAVENRMYYIPWVCVCSLSYLARNAYAPFYIIICDLFSSTIFFHIISQTE